MVSQVQNADGLNKLRDIEKRLKGLVLKQEMPLSIEGQVSWRLDWDFAFKVLLVGWYVPNFCPRL